MKFCIIFSDVCIKFKNIFEVEKLCYKFQNFLAILDF